MSMPQVKLNFQWMRRVNILTPGNSHLKKRRVNIDSPSRCSKDRRTSTVFSTHLLSHTSQEQVLTAMEIDRAFSAKSRRFKISQTSHSLYRLFAQEANKHGLSPQWGKVLRLILPFRQNPMRQTWQQGLRWGKTLARILLPKQWFHSMNKEDQAWRKPSEMSEFKRTYVTSLIRSKRTIETQNVA